MRDFRLPTPEMTEAEADRRLASDRNDFEAMLAKAENLLRQQDHRAASAYFGAAAQIGQKTPGVPPDRLLRIRDAMQWIEARYLDHIYASLKAAGHPEQDWHPRFRRSLEIMTGKRLRDPPGEAFPQLPTAFYYDGLPYFEFADAGAFAWRESVEAATDAIRDEAQALLRTDGTFGPYVKKATDRPQGDVHGLLDNTDWSTFDLTAKGQPVADRIELCPQTHAAITNTGAVCDVPNRAPTIMFSLLRAGKRIAPHTGMINTRLICHLPLIVPGEGKLRVGSEARQWVEGELMAFDDTVEHEAWNGAPEDRLVLIFDVWRPEIEPIERAQINALFAAVDSY